MRRDRLLAFCVVVLVGLLGIATWRSFTGDTATAGAAQKTGKSPAVVLSAGMTAALDPDTRKAAAVDNVPEPGARATDNALGVRALSIVVVDQAGKRLGGIEVALLASDTTGWEECDAFLRDAPREVARGTTDAEGTWTPDVEPGSEYVALAPAVRTPAFAQARSSACVAGQTVELVLSTGAALHGRVTRIDGGAPVAHARIRMQLEDGATIAGYLDAAFTDERGEYRVEGLSGGRWIVEALVADLAASPFAIVALPPGGELRHDIELATGATLRGRVVDAVNRGPIAGARVGEQWFLRRSVTTDDSGAFAFPGYLRDGDARVYVEAEGYARAASDVPIPALEDGSLVLALTRAVTINGSVTDEAGTALANARIECIGGAELDVAEHSSARTDDEGRFRLGGLRPNVAHQLLVRCDGFADQRMLVQPLPGDFDASPFVLTPAARVSGTVVDAEGLPLAGIAVELDDLSQFPAEPRSRSTRSDARGGFVFSRLDPSIFRVAATRGTTRVESEVVTSPGSSHDVELRCEPADRALAGTVVDGRGEALANVTLTLNGTAPWRAEVRTCSDSDGRFTFDSLARGAYTLAARPPRTTSGGRRLLCPTELRGLTPTSRDIVVTLAIAVPTRGRVLGPSGESRAGVFVLASDEAGIHVDSSLTNDDGEFELYLPEKTSARLRVVAQTSITGGVAVVSKPSEVLATVTAGARDIELRP